jgi:hypothetical protein
MSPRLLRPRASNANVASDADARAYIEAVRLADGQYMEPAVQLAVNSFVAGCKADGIWSAIKASCILCGARTLSGALTPLVGSAPTNNNFVSGDYNRKTGLVGNGSTKYLNTNRNNNADPQNSFHMAVYRSVANEAASAALIGAGGGGDAGRSNVSVVQNEPLTGGYFFRSRNNAANGDGLGLSSAGQNDAGFAGHARTSSTNVDWVAVSQSGSFSRASDTPLNQTITVFGQISSAQVFGGAAASRLAFYSVGESLNLFALSSRVSTLYTAIGAALAPNYADADVNAYINAVETADGQLLETGVRDAINTFITGCKSDGTWTAIKASCILCGARTLSGALTPLVGAAPTNNNFVSGDYNRKTGLVGDGSTKYLDSNRANNADGQNSNHHALYITTVHAITGGFAGGYMGAGLSSGANNIGRSTAAGNPLFTRSRNSTADVHPDSSSGTATGLVGISRSDSTSYSRRVGGASATLTVSSQSPSSENVWVFRRNSPGTPGTEVFSNGRMSFYSIGESLDLALLDTRVSALYTAIGAAIP